MELEMAVCVHCSRNQTECVCPRRPAQPKTLAEQLDWRFVEITQQLTKHCDSEWQTGYDALEIVKAIFKKHYERPGYTLTIDPTAPHMQALLPEVPTTGNEVCPYNTVKGQFAVLLDTIRLHIPAVDFLEAAAALKVPSD